MTLTAQGKPLTDDELVAWLDTRVRLANGFSDSRLSREREMLAEYYDAQQPAPLHKGSSRYVSQDVYDSVESMKATLLETFTGNAKPVQFAPTSANDVEEARIATAFTDYVVFRQNPGYSIFHDVLHDGLMARVGIAQVYWREEFDWREESVGNTDLPTAQQTILALAKEGSKIRNVHLEDHEDGTFTVTLERMVDLSQVVIESVPPEEFGISPRAKDLDSAEVCYRRSKKSKSDLIKLGYAKDVIEDIWEDDKVWLDTEPEVIQRFSQVDDASYLGLNDELQDARRQVMVYEVFCNLDMTGSGKSERYRVVFAGNRVLEKFKVSRLPFVTFTPLPKPHSFWGSAFAEKVIFTQNARTLLTRSIIDHAMVTTNPRFTVVRGGLTNPKELIENRLGGIVNITRDGAVQPLPQAALNPFIFQTIQLLDEDKEEATGISKLSQGLNKDAISQQNSADMVQQMVSVSQQRQKVIARNFATGFLRELFLLTYQLVIENERRQNVVQIAGDWVPVDPMNWAERKDVTVEFAIGYGEQEKEISKFVQMHQMLASVPALQHSYGPPQQYATMRKILETGGIKDVSTYLQDPTKMQPPQPDPTQVALQQIPLREIAVKERHQQLEEHKFATEAQRKSTETALKAGREGAKVQMGQDAADLQRAKFEHSMTVDAAEIALQRRGHDIAEARPTTGH